MRITLDTNQLVKALMRPPDLATLIMAWQSNRFRVVASQDLIDEYERVIAYPTVSALILPELLRAFRTHLVNVIEVIPMPVIAPVCRDPDDDKVIATAIYGRVAYLVSEDEDVRTPTVQELLKQYGISVVSTQQLIEILDVNSL
jgi:putative PIN family toxin of toxin-antitoxin system